MCDPIKMDISAMPHKYIWELPVLRYHKILVIYPYPFLVVITQLLIHQGHIRSDREIPQGSDRLDKRGDVRIQGLWDIRTDAIIDVVIGNTDTVTYRFDPTITLLDR